MKLLIATSLLGVIAAGGTLLSGPPARAETDTTRTLDRTYTCAVFLRGGVYLVETHAHAGTRRAGAWARLPYAGVRTGAFSGGVGNLLAWITSGKPTPETMIDQDYNTFDVKTFGTVGVRRKSVTDLAACTTGHGWADRRRRTATRRREGVLRREALPLVA